MGAGSLVLALALAAFAAKPFPEPPRDYVHNEGVVSAAAEQRLSARLSAFERETGHQFVVALFESLEGESLEDYSNRLFKHWRIGDAQRDDGVLLALFKKDRRWRVEVGYGLESTVTDLEAGRYLDDLAVPRFRQGDFDGGVETAATALIARLSGRAPPAPRPLAHAPPAPDAGGSGFEYGMAIVLLVFFVGLLIHMLLSGVDWSSGGVSWSSGGTSGWDAGGSSSSSSCDSGGFSGGGGSSGGGGASGSW